MIGAIFCFTAMTVAVRNLTGPGAGRRCHN